MSPCRLTLCLVWLCVSAGSALAACPPGCVCLGHQLHCPSSTVDAIPAGSSLPGNITIMTLSGNRFRSPRLSSRNFTGLSQLEKLSLSGCGLHRIDSDTFSGMTGLKLLDLSKNSLTSLSAGAFAGLQLEYLFLSDNADLAVPAALFRDMSAEVLDLQNCSLTDVNPSLFSPMIGKLRKLFLQRNRISRLAPAMLAVLTSLETLRLYDNPLACDCHAVWLKQFYDSHAAVIGDASRGLTEEPRCSTPPSLQSRPFQDLTPEHFVCEKPTIAETSVWVNRTASVLSCQGVSYSPATVTWYKPDGTAQTFHSQGDLASTAAELIVINSQATAAASAGLYRCVVRNQGGNVSFSVNLALAGDLYPPPAVGCLEGLPDGTSDSGRLVPATLSPNKTGEPAGHDPLRSKYFTLVDLLSAVLGTFVGTLLISVVVLHFCVYGRKRKSSGSQYSNSSSPMSDYGVAAFKNGPSASSSYPATSGTSCPMMLHSPLSPQCIQNRPLPNTPYARVYDDLSSPLDERDELDSTISPYGHLQNSRGASLVLTQDGSRTAAYPACEACRSHNHPPHMTN